MTAFWLPSPIIASRQEFSDGEFETVGIVDEIMLAIKLLAGAPSASEADEASVREAIERLAAENMILRGIVSRCADALPCGAYISPKAPLDFMGLLPDEIAKTCEQLAEDGPDGDHFRHTVKVTLTEQKKDS